MSHRSTRVAYTLEKIELLRKTYPGKRIVVSEFGWPSQGYNRLDADPGRLTQAKIIRDFIAEAETARHRVQHH